MRACVRACMFLFWGDTRQYCIGTYDTYWYTTRYKVSRMDQSAPRILNLVARKLFVFIQTRYRA